MTPSPVARPPRCAITFSSFSVSPEKRGPLFSFLDLYLEDVIPGSPRRDPRWRGEEPWGETAWPTTPTNIRCILSTTPLRTLQQLIHTSRNLSSRFRSCSNNPENGAKRLTPRVILLSAATLRGGVASGKEEEDREGGRNILIGKVLNSRRNGKFVRFLGLARLVALTND